MNKQNYKEVSTIGRWGRMHGRYLKDNHPVRYTVLLLSGKLNGYLVEYSTSAYHSFPILSYSFNLVYKENVYKKTTERKTSSCLRI